MGAAEIAALPFFGARRGRQAAAVEGRHQTSWADAMQGFSRMLGSRWRAKKSSLSEAEGGHSSESRTAGNLACSHGPARASKTWGWRGSARV